ncbi:MAG: complex I NDUFA9 subunit family protein [candidate division Zixibacteria bacterium]
MNIILAGATGFVGSNLGRKLIENGHEVKFIVRPGTETKIPLNNKPLVISADPGKSLEHLRVDADLLINAIGIIREFPRKGITFKKAHIDITRNLVEFARSNGISRFIQISALGVGPHSVTGYQKSKYDAEEYIWNSGLKWTILRPSMIFGPGDHITGMFANMIKRLPVMPVIGDGNYQLQPVHVDDISAGVIGAIDDKRVIDKTFEIGGPEIMTFNRVLDEIGAALGRKKVKKIHQPVPLMKALSGIFERFAWFPVTGEQITMLLEGNFTNDRSFFDLYGIIPRKFNQSLNGLLSK